MAPMVSMKEILAQCDSFEHGYEKATREVFFKTGGFLSELHCKCDLQMSVSCCCENLKIMIGLQTVVHKTHRKILAPATLFHSRPVKSISR